jgi:L,D-transpeptidase ErfK/SrfK
VPFGILLFGILRFSILYKVHHPIAMAVIRKKNPIAEHFMGLSLSTGLLLLLLSIWQRYPQAPPIEVPPAPMIADSPRAQDTKLIVDLSDRRVILYRHNREKARYAVAIGQTGWETPVGEFKIQQLREHPDWRHPITQQVIPAGPDNPLGSRWIGFYYGEHMALGFHGTPNESLVGQAVSHGCLRMFNRDIEALYAQVGTGVTVAVQP